MTTTTKDTLRIIRNWESILENNEPLEKRDLEKDIEIIDRFLILSSSREECNAVRQCREYLFRRDYDCERLLYLTAKASAVLERHMERKRNCGGNDLYGQAKRFKGTTGNLFNEKLRFLDGENLRNVDVELEDGATSRKVRRIVEKRMCQAYHKQNKSGQNHGNGRRHYMQRATSFQLFNIGQVENVRYKDRGESTHWKRVYDPNTGDVVFKKKTAFSSYEEAMNGIQHFRENHPTDSKEMHAYVCSHCGRYHIGHDSHYARKFPDFAQPMP